MDLAEACGNRTHPGRLSTTRNGFEARENHQAPCASDRDYNRTNRTNTTNRTYFFLSSLFKKRCISTGALT
jgi:hypothetical protein